MKSGLVIILMGSPSDLPHVEKIIEQLDEFSIQHEKRIASAHKTPGILLEMIQAYERLDAPKVYITVAGRSNALSGMVDAQVTAPVIACPPPSSTFGGGDILSSLRMPSGVAPMVVLDPANAALAAAKVLAVADPEIQKHISDLQGKNANRLAQADKELNQPHE